MIQLTAYIVMDRLVYCLTAARVRDDGSREWVNLALEDVEVPSYIRADNAGEVAWLALHSALTRVQGLDLGEVPF